MKLKNLFLLFLLFLFFSFSLYSKNYSINIIGNQYIDKQLVISLIDSIPEDYNKIDKSKIIEELNNTGYFKTIEVSTVDNSLNIKLEEYPVFKEVYFKKNKRFKKDDLLKIFQENNEYNIYNEYNLNNTIEQYYELYKSFGYNSISIEYEVKNTESDEIDIYFNIDEGKISKIRNINFTGNELFSNNQLMNQIKSRERNYLNFIYNSNFKTNVLNDDLIRLLNFYQNNGFKNVKIDLKYEFDTSSNYFDVYFNIKEGFKYFINKIDVKASDDLFNDIQLNKLNLIIDRSYLKQAKYKKTNIIYNEEFLNNLKKDLAKYIFQEGLYFFEIALMERVENDLVSVLFDINSVEPIYIKNIDIFGNTRTKESVIRRELEFAEGDAYNDLLVNKSSSKLKKLGIFSDVKIEKNQDGSVIVEVKEKPTGSFQIGVGFNSYDGATFVAELNERNFQGTGRTLNLRFDNSSNRSNYKLGVVKPYAFNKDVDLIYNINYSETDLSKRSSYNYNNFVTEVGLDYLLQEKLSHRVTLGYSLKNYEITDKNNVSSSILNLSGTNAEYLLNNTLVYNRLDSLIKPTNGDYTNFTNVFSPITNSTNGYTKNTIKFRKYYSKYNNIYSIQSLLGNVVSLQNETIDNSDKFSLGGRWLRGFDHYGAGPRDSRSSYIGGNNLAVAKFDILRPLDKFAENPIYIDLFTDVGKVWSNKNSPTFNNEEVRSSFGFGLNYYSPIGPIGFTWGFPISDEPEDIKRMFTFSIGYLN